MPIRTSTGRLTYQPDQPRIPLVDLLVPMGHANRSIGACVLSHKWFMLFYLLMEKKLVDLRVTPISPNLPPSGYRQLNVGRRLPVVLMTKTEGHEDATAAGLLAYQPTQVAETEDEKDELLQQLNCSSLKPQNVYVSILCDIGAGLNILLDRGSSGRLFKGLRNLDQILAQNGKLFLCSDQPGFTDCALAPKLQHVRVAGGYYRGFRISESLTDIWKYLANIYKLNAFLVSCPSDKNILLHYLPRVLKHDRTKLLTEQKRIFLIHDSQRLMSCMTHSILHAPTTFSSLISLDTSENLHEKVDSSTEEILAGSFPVYNEFDRPTSATLESATGAVNRANNFSEKFLHVYLPLADINRRYLYKQISPLRYFSFHLAQLR